MRRVRLVLAYDGTGFVGFQRQPGARTVQGELETFLSHLCGHAVQVTGAGRTDTGVHATGQVVHFDTTGRVPAERLERIAQGQLGPELAVRCVEEARPEFHARFQALRRTYHYYVCRETPSPFTARYLLRETGFRTDGAERIAAALEPLVGRHDFRAFCAAGGKRHSTVRTLFQAGVEERGPLLRVGLTADAFLRTMVRNVVGVLLEIGRGRRAPEVLAQALEAGERPAAVVPAPPQGLFLAQVEYADGYPPESHTATLPWWEEDARTVGDGSLTGARRPDQERG